MLVPECHCSHLGYTLTLHQPADTLRGTLCIECRRLESKMRAFVLPEVNVTRLGYQDAGVAPLPTRFRIILDETVKDLAFCLVLNTFSVVTTDASLLVPSSTSDLDNSMWQSVEICQVLSTGAFVYLPHVRRYNGLLTISTRLPILSAHVRKNFLPPLSFSCS